MTVYGVEAQCMTCNARLRVSGLWDDAETTRARLDERVTAARWMRLPGNERRPDVAHVCAECQLEVSAIPDLALRLLRDDMERAWKALDGLYEDKGQGAASEHHDDMANAIRRIRDYIDGEDREAAKAEDAAPEMDWCDNCDGCGWVEGGMTIKSDCHVCKGRGRVPTPTRE